MGADGKTMIFMKKTINNQLVKVVLWLNTLVFY